MDFTFTKKAKFLSMALMTLGVIALVYGFVGEDDEHHTRWWANLMINGFFWFAISLGALYFMVLQYATEASWATMVKRIFEAITSYLPYGAIVLVIVFLGSTLHWNHIYHWMAEGITDLEHENFDAIIARKAAFLNAPFWWFRTLVYLGTFIFFARWFRRKSLQQDQLGGTEIHFKSYKMAGFFLVLFAIFSSSLSWDWLMSIDAHWFSTMYGWYVFSGMWVTGIVMTIIIVMYLKSQGYLKEVNDSHLHDLGKWMFAISFLWSYLWFSQFMLIWYADIPEEVTYFVERIEQFKVPFFTMFFVNFAMPMVILMSRDAKRNPGFLITIAAIILAGHWMDVYLLIMPGTVHHWHMGFMEIGMALGFVGLFFYVVLNTLSKAPLLVRNHPYMEESRQHSI